MVLRVGGTATQVDDLEVFSYFSQEWERVPDYSNWQFFADAANPDYETNPLRFMHHKPTASYNMLT